MTFQAEQARIDGLVADDARRRAFGFGGWRADLAVADGMVSVERLEAVLPSGAVVQVPGNAEIAPRSLVDAARSGRGTVALRLGVPVRRVDRACATVADEGHARYRVRPVRVLDENDDADREEQELLVRVLAARILVGDEPDDGLETMPLGAVSFERDATGALADDVAPPLLRLGAWPPLLSRLRGLLGALREVAEGIVRTLADQPFAIAANAPEHLEQILRLQALNRAIGVLEPLLAGDDAHPFDAYRALVFVRADLAVFEPERIDARPAAYDHLEPAQALLDLVADVRSRAGGRPVRAAAESIGLEPLPDDPHRMTGPLPPHWFAERRAIFVHVHPGDRALAEVRCDVERHRIKLFGDRDRPLLDRAPLPGCHLEPVVHQPAALPAPRDGCYFRLRERATADPRWAALAASGSAVAWNVDRPFTAERITVYAVPPALA